MRILSAEDDRQFRERELAEKYLRGLRLFYGQLDKL